MTTAHRISKLFPALGTFNEITAFGPDCSPALERAEARVRELHARWSVFDPDSEISRLNKSAGQGPVPIGADTLSVLLAAKRMAAWSDGTFTVTARPLTALWNIGPEGQGAVPERQALVRARALARDADLILDERGCTAALRRRGEAVDLGGIAKGYAADEVRRILREGGVERAIINLGGTVIAMGEERTVGIQHPRQRTGIAMGQLRVRDQAVVTSGDYERWFEQGGRRYCHILDPRTGESARSGLCAVTAVGESAMELDALTTAIFVLGAERGMALARRAGAEVLLVTDGLDVLCSDGLRDRFTPETNYYTM